MTKQTIETAAIDNILDSIAEKASDERCRELGIPLYWCESIGRFVTIPERE